MSVVEQGAASTSDAEVAMPEFAVGLRGYDRHEVESFVRDLQGRISVERRRAEQSERSAAQMRAELASLRNQPPSFEHLGAEAARVLEQAGASAKLLLEEARNRGRSVVEEAEGQAQELIEHAERRAGELESEAGETLAEAAGERERILAEAAESAEEVRGRAEEDARTALEHARDATERMRQKAVSDQLTMQSETERLSESRGRMLEYLGRIHTDLGALLAEAVQIDVEPAAEVGAEPEAPRPPRVAEDGSEASEGDREPGVAAPTYPGAEHQ